MIPLHRQLACATGLLFTIACATSARGDTNQFWLAAQHDWGGKRGFFLALASEFPAGEQATLENLRLNLGIGDGQAWHILAHAGPWELGRTYVARVVITPAAAELWLDGKRIAQQDLKPAALDAPLASNEQPSFLRGPANYMVRQIRIEARGRDEPIRTRFDETKLPLQLRLFNPSAGAERRPFVVRGDASVEVEFVLEEQPDLRALAPFVDRYGQVVQAEWPGKVRDEAQLQQADEAEARRFAEWGEPEGRDAFGGIKEAPGWNEKGTGFFRTIRRNGYWWLVTPEGNPCFYVGLDDAPAVDWECTPTDGREYLFESLPDRSSPFAPAWRINPWSSALEEGKSYIAPHTINLIRKYGAQDWKQRAVDSAIRRAKVLGFSGFGKWTPTEGVKGISDVAVLYHGEIPNLVRHPDIFDPTIRARWADLLRRQIEPRRNDPYLIGWSVGNEFDENIAAADIVKILAMPPDVPARKALFEHALNTIYDGDEDKQCSTWNIFSLDDPRGSPQPPAEDVETLRRYYADAYYRFIYETVKSIDPNHLYLGMWVTPNWWENEADWDLIAPHCDVIGYDFYNQQFDAEPTGRLLAKYDKPALCGEFSFAPDYGGTRGYGRYHNATRDEQESARIYTRWMDAAARHPKCVGVFYFQYRDQPVTGRGPMTGPPGLVHGENFAFGIVDVTDRLKWDFVEPLRAANLTAHQTRLDLTAGGDGADRR